MTTAPRARKKSAPAPPPQQDEPIIHGDTQTLLRWLIHYWEKLALPTAELPFLAMTQDRREFARWTGKRLNPLVLGCYCYLSTQRADAQRPTSGSPHTMAPVHWHLIFIEPDMQPQSIEVTIAHELIHLADRVNGTPRRHRHHGFDAIAVEEAAITGYSLEELRALLHEEGQRREKARRAARPLRYLYECPHCKKQYPRARRYSQPVSCSSCDKDYNPRFHLRLASLL
ncbi:SprT-like family protein [Thermosporothrix hazakensis]|jgi:predicted SprT family Zn-dependent metalloprotease|uniref:SprT-like family protein n=1 Tax=Thermosporothrix hazakensis TaxID=644383 RepID=A0A326UBU3_THEHA|nr:hypothetical protein [Thermosporothrix hazakensis]PZW25645.1 SprT-like family protein [Thermosporothrix hazakensis]GCE48140.1 hypothetical protein KTH_30090 [Thermosporothrix hazakensis]